MGIGDPEDLTGAVLLLCSDAGRFITGTDIKIDGESCLELYLKVAPWSKPFFRRIYNFLVEYLLERIPFSFSIVIASEPKFHLEGKSCPICRVWSQFHHSKLS